MTNLTIFSCDIVIAISSRGLHKTLHSKSIHYISVSDTYSNMVLSDIENELDYAIDDGREVDSAILDEPDVSTEDKEPVVAADIDPTMPAEDAKVSDEIQMDTEEVPDQSVTPIDKVPDDSKLSITYDSSGMPIPNGINVENSPEKSYDPSLMPSIEVKVPNVKKHPSIQKRLEKIKSKVVAKAVSSIHNRNLQPKVDGEAEKEELAKLHRLKVSTDGHIATVWELLGDTSLLSVDVLIELQGALTDGIRDLARAQNRIHSVTFSRYFYQRRKNRKETSPVSQDVETLSNSFQTLSLEVADLCDDLSDKLTVRFKEVSNKLSPSSSHSLSLNSNRRWETARPLPDGRKITFLPVQAPPEEPCCSSSLKRSNNRPIVCSPSKAEKRDEPVQSIAAVPRGESV